MDLRTLRLAIALGGSLLLATSALAEPKDKEHGPKDKAGGKPGAAEKAAPAASPQEDEIARLLAAKKELQAQIQKLRAESDKHHRAASAAQMRWKAWRAKKGAPKPAKDPLDEAKTEAAQARTSTDGLAPLSAQMTASDERLAAIVKQLEDAAAQAKAAAEQAAKTAAEAKKAAVEAAALAMKAKARAAIGNAIALAAKQKREQDALAAQQKKVADLTKAQSELEVQAQSQPAPEAKPAEAKPAAAKAAEAKPAP